MCRLLASDGRICPREAGFTLIEVLIAASVITIAFAAIGTGIVQGTSSVEVGRQQTTAIFLAEQRIEQLKAWSLSTAPNQGWATVATGANCCTDEGYNTIASYGKYRRSVLVIPSGANNKIVLVMVSYFPVNPAAGNAGNERRVDLATVVTNR